MPLPNRQLAKLRRESKEHAKRAAELREQASALEVEADVHAALVALSDDEALLAALGEIYDDPDLTSDVADNPRAFFTARGVTFPRGAQIAISGSGRAATLSMTLERKTRRVRAQWHRTQGFEAADVPPDA